MMNLLIFDYSFGHSRHMEDDPFLKSARQRRHDYNSETEKKNSNICICTTLNEDGVVTTNISEDRVRPTNSHPTDVLHFSTETGEIYIF